jgi:hypothetical protein
LPAIFRWFGIRTAGRSRPEPEIDYTTDPGTGVRYVLIPTGGGARVRLELSAGGAIRYRPGAADAVAAGCTCDPAKNNAGAGGLHDDHHVFIFRKDCPLHPEIGPPGTT